MLLRPRQKQFVEHGRRDPEEHGRQGLRARPPRRVDRSESQQVRRVNPRITTSVIDAKEKIWAGQVTFAMVPTLARSGNLDQLPALDLLVIDEAHHAAADSYRRIIDTALQRNPLCRVYGVTATPNRGDKRGLRPVFSNVADQIRIGELIASGHLVPPRTFVIDVGVHPRRSSGGRHDPWPLSPH
jgi:superfamily II DNA or RNA helicase